MSIRTDSLRAASAEHEVEPSHGEDAEQTRGHWARSDLVGLGLVVVVGLLVLVPALARGTSLGPFDILQTSGLNKTPGVTVHNSTLLDQIRLFIPWTSLVWTQVHQGHLPLWNSYSVLGVPLAFNWESAPLSLPVLIGYLFPLHLAYTAQLIVTVTVAGTGVYVLGKLLRLGTLGCMTAAIVFELSGPFIGFLGWPMSAVTSWGGWLFAAIVLVLRGDHRARSIVLLAVVLAFAIYAGDPEGVLLLVLAAAIFAIAMLVLRSPALGGSGPVKRPVFDLGVSAVAGAALAAPLILPGIQFGKVSNRNAVGPALFPKGLPPHELVHLIFQGFDGLPLAGSQWFGLSAYEATSAYVGVTVLVLAASALVLRWRGPEVRSLALVAVGMGLLVFAPPIVSLLDSTVTRIYWVFALTPMVLAIAVLSGIGMDILVKSYAERRVQRALGIGFAGMGIVLGIIWLVDRGGLTAAQRTIRDHSFIWPTVEVGVGLLVVWALARVSTRSSSRLVPAAVGAGNAAGSVLLVVVTGFLLASSAPLISSSASYPTSTPQVAALKRAVGNATVGFGASQAFASTAGITSNANLLYDVHEFAIYDPLTPREYFLLDDAQGYPLSEEEDIYSPAITSARTARLYGIGYLLEPAGVSGPKGSVFVRSLGREDLYRIPGAAAATLVATGPNGSSPGTYAPGAPVAVAHPSPSSWRMVTHGATQSVLRLRLTNVPGWRATIDGKPVPLRPFARTMLEVSVPAGRHQIELQYWPRTFSVGIVLALCSAVGLALLLIVARVRSRRTQRESPGA